MPDRAGPVTPVTVPGRGGRSYAPITQIPQTVTKVYPLIQWPDGTWHRGLPPGPDPSTTGSPGTGDTPSQQQIREATVTAANGPIPIVYGTQRVGGRIFYVNTFSGLLVLGVALAEGPVSSLAVGNVTIDNALLATCVANGWVASYELHDGALTQPVSTILSGWFGYTQTHPGLCYLVLAINGAAPWSSIPNILAKIDGLLCYDPRTTTTIFTRNPSLIARDMMTRAGGLVTADFDDTTVGDSATYYDVTIDGEPRYALNLAIVAEGKLSTWLATVRGHCGLNIYPDQGVYVFAPDKVLSSPIALDDSHLTNVRISRKNMVDVPTRLTLEWTNAANDWITDTVTAETDGVAAGTEEAIEGTISCPGLTSYKTAQRHVLYTLRRENFSNLIINATVSAMAERLRRGDYVTITHRGSPAGAPAPTYRLAAQGAIVADVRPRGSGIFDVTFEEYDANAYSTAAYVPDTPPVTFLPGQTTVPNLYIRFDANDWPTMCKCWWEVRPLVPPSLYGAAYWTLTTPGSAYTPTPAKVNDADTTNVAFGFDGAGSNELRFDAGAGATKRFVAVKLWWPSSITLIDSSGAPPYGVYYWLPLVQFSDDGSTWTTAEDRYLGVHSHSGADIKLYLSGVWRGYQMQFNDYGAHRYWRLTYGGAANVNRVWTEVQFIEGTGVVFDETLIDHYEVHARGSNGECTIYDPTVMNLPASSRPTYDTHLDLSKLGIVYQTGALDPLYGNLLDYLDVRVVTVLRDGSRSAGDVVSIHGDAYLNVVAAPGFVQSAAPAVQAGISRMYADASTKQLMLSNDGAPYVAIATGAAAGTTVNLQASTPGTAQTGHANISGTFIAGTSLQVGGSPSFATIGQSGQYSIVNLMGTTIGISSTGWNVGAGSTDMTLYLNSPAQIQFRIANVGTALLDSSGRFGCGTLSLLARGTFWDGSSAPPSIVSGTVLHLGGANASVPRLLLDSFGAATAYSGRRANGTAASPSGVAADDVLTQLTGFGYTSAAAYSSAGAVDIQLRAAEAWSGSALGSYITVRTTLIGTTTLAEKMRITDTGRVGIGTTNPQVAGLEVSGNTKVALDSGNGFLWIANSTAPTNYTTANYDRLGIGYSSNIATIQTSAAGTGTLRAIQIMSGGSLGLYIDQNNKVGCGVVPSATFHVSGAGGEIRIDDTSATGAQWRVLAASGTTKAFRIYDQALGLERMKIDASGYITANIGFVGPCCTVPQNPQASTYTLALTDRGKHIFASANITVPASIFSAGDIVTIYNNTASNFAILQAASVTLYFAGSGATGNRNLGQRGVATVLCVASNTFVISGGGLT